MIWRLDLAARSKARANFTTCGINRATAPLRHRGVDALRRRSASALPGVLALSMLAGCAVHPIPDDVSPIPTEAIIAAARCELRQGLVEQVKVWFADETRPVDPNVISPELVADQLDKMVARYKVDKNDWQEYLDIAIAYDWSFEITEANRVDSSVGFKLPFINPGPGSLDAGASGSLTLGRSAKRTFKSQDKFSNLLRESWFNFCNDKDRSSKPGYYNTPEGHPPYVPRDPNLLYPISGSIGLARAVTSFLRIAVQEGAVDTFTDELAFTTTWDGKAGASVTLSPVPKEFRLVSGSLNLAGTRTDLHKVKISLAFPKARAAQKTKNQLVSEEQKKLEVRGGYPLNANWRATYALCVVDGRTREDELKTLRQVPPEVSCLESTDALFPRGTGRANSLLTGHPRGLVDNQFFPEAGQAPDAGQPPAPEPGSVAPRKHPPK
jgi:hypothetical protein